MYAFLETRHNGFIFMVFFMRGKTISFIFKEANLSHFFGTQNARLLPSWPCLAGVAAAYRAEFWHIVPADLTIGPGSNTGWLVALQPHHK